MSMTYEELKKEFASLGIESENYDDQDFWHWFLTNDQIDMNKKVHIIDWFMSEFYLIEGVIEYMKDIGVIK